MTNHSQQTARPLIFKIHGMDCAEEVAVLKRELGPIVGGEDRLAFDVINGKITIVDGRAEPEAISAAVARTGMRAVEWEAHLEAQASEGGESFWMRHGRSVACAASGVGVAVGFAVHAIAAGSFLAALTGGEAGEAVGYPFATKLIYAAAALAGAWHVAPKALFAARRLRPDMNFLMVIAVIGAMGIGEWMEAGVVAFLFAAALLLESWSVGRARRAIRSLVELSPATARTICPHDGDITERPVEDVSPGSIVVVRPGEKVPLDGVITTGATAINEAPITGESTPASKEVGDEVYAGTINLEAAIEFETSKAAGDTTLAQMIRLIEQAQSRRAPAEQWVERFARVYTPAMMMLAVVVALGPPLLAGAGWADSVYQALVILVIACPCALVISTPVSVVAGLTSAARAGVLIKGGAYLEMAGRIRAIALDKTGTLTVGRPEVQEILPMNGHTSRELIERAAALESHSLHPLARSVLERAHAEGVDFAPAEETKLLAGRGIEGRIEGRKFWVGSHRLVHDLDAEQTGFHKLAVEKEDAGHSLVVVGNEDHICGVLCVADSIRAESRSAIAELKALGVELVVMLTGDNEGVARAIAAAAGLDRFEAELLPEDKVESVGKLAREHGVVAMIGDGVNDAPAMASASLGIAMGAIGADAAIETADIALMSDDLSRVPWLVRHARRTLGIIKQNIAFALGLKLVFILLAFFGLATLWMAIAADMGASFLVIFNGLRLLRA